MKLTRQQMIDERHEIYLKLMKGMADATDMSTAKYAHLNDRYQWLNEKIRKSQK
jgi:hypothetical protein